MSKTTDTMILCKRCGNSTLRDDNTCTGCGYERYSAYRCDFCGNTVTARVYSTLRICIPCAKAELEGLAYKYATLDANIQMLKVL